VTGQSRIQAVAIFAVALVVVFVAVWVGARGHFATYGGVDTAPYPGSGLFGGWFRFDGNWYALIATKGYWFSGPSVQSPVAYFPGYPGLLWALHGISGVSVKLLGSLVTIACGAAASVGVLRWFRDRVTDRVARLALITLLVSCSPACARSSCSNAIIRSSPVSPALSRRRLDRSG
jgi:hypothetical protein